METILEFVEEGNDDVEEEMVDDELQSRNGMIDDVSSERDSTSKCAVQWCSVCR